MRNHSIRDFIRITDLLKLPEILIIFKKKKNTLFFFQLSYVFGIFIYSLRILIFDINLFMASFNPNSSSNIVITKIDTSARLCFKPSGDVMRRHKKCHWVLSGLLQIFERRNSHLADMLLV